jgi:hypothetical protein
MIYKIYRDIVNFFLIRKAIKKAKRNALWKKYNLRHDWIYRTYTVINATKYEIGDEPVVLQAKIVEKTKPINAFVDSLKIGDLVAVSIEKIPESESFLLVYYPIFNYLTVWRIFVFSLLLIIGIGIGLAFL